MSSSRPTPRRARRLLAGVFLLTALVLGGCTSQEDEVSDVLTAVPATATPDQPPAEPTAPDASTADPSDPESSSSDSSGASSGGGQGQTPLPDPVAAPPSDAASPASPDVVTAPPVDAGDDGQSDALDINVDLDVEFDPGASQTTQVGSLFGDEVDRYSLDVLSGQTVSIDITSPEENAVVDLFAPSGSRIMGQKTSDTVTVSEDGVYEAIVRLTGENAVYEVTFTIE